MNPEKVVSDDRKEWISSLAESIVNKLFPSNAPVNPELIAYKYDISYCYGDYGDYFDGMLQHSEGSFHIFINTDKHNNVQRHRFSFAHELGHYFIDEHAIALAQNKSAGHCSVTGFISDSVVEREADLFAASLLMPKTRLIRQYSLNRRFSFEIIEGLTKTFQVSTLAALYRVFYLDLHPMMIVKVVNGRLQGMPLRSKDFYFWLRDKQLPDDSGAYHFFHSNKKFKTRELYAFDWFKTDSTQKIYEHCLYLEKMNTVICIIWCD